MLVRSIDMDIHETSIRGSPLNILVHIANNTGYYLEEISVIDYVQWTIYLDVR